MSNSKQIWHAILRWIAVLPTSILGMILAYGLWRIIHNATAARYIDTNSWLNIVFVEIMSNLFAGGIFVYIGFKISPAFQKIVAIVLASLILLLSGTSLFIVNFMTKEYLSNIGIISMNIGSIVCCISIFKGEIEEVED